MKKTNLLQQPALAVRSTGGAGVSPFVVPELPPEVVEMFKRIGASKQFTAADSLKRYESVPVDE